jgi:hypothetical protein
MRSKFAAMPIAVLLSACSAAVDDRSSLGARMTVAPSHIETVASRSAGAPRDGEFVTAESLYGTGTVSGPVRVGPKGRREVRMPGGTWIECGRSCSDTLRRETVDFWQSRGGRNDPVDGPGYFRRWW